MARLQLVQVGRSLIKMHICLSLVFLGQEEPGQKCRRVRFLIHSMILEQEYIYVLGGTFITQASLFIPLATDIIIKETLLLQEWVTK